MYCSNFLKSTNCGQWHFGQMVRGWLRTFAIGWVNTGLDEFDTNLLNPPPPIFFFIIQVVWFSINISIPFKRHSHKAPSDHSGATIWCLMGHLVFGVLIGNSYVPTNALDIDPIYTCWSTNLLTPKRFPSSIHVFPKKNDKVWD